MSLPSILGGVGSVLGIADGFKSIFGGGGDSGGYDGSEYADQLKKQRDDAKLRARNLPLHQVRGLEKAGLNPGVFFGGMNVGAGAGYVPSIGDSHSTSGGLFAQTLQMNHEKELQETALAQENEKLREEIDNLSKPRQPGYMEQYGGILPLPSEGGSNAPQNPEKLRVVGLRAGGDEASAARQLTITTPYGEIKGDPRWTPTEQIEDEYGEPVAWAYSGLRAADLAADQIAQGVDWAVREYGGPVTEFVSSIGDSHGITEDRDYGDRWRGTRPRSIMPTQSEIDKHTYRRNAFGG